MIIQDLHVHVSILGEHKEDGGNIILSWVEKHTLILLNNDTNCKGMYTWEGRESKSVTDYSLINNQIYNKFKYMVVTEAEKELIDLTDHNLLQVRLKKTNMTKQKAVGCVRETEYQRYDEKSLQDFVQEVEKECNKSRKYGITKTVGDNKESNTS